MHHYGDAFPGNSLRRAGGTLGNPVKFQVCKTAGRPHNPDRENALKGEMLNLLCFREPSGNQLKIPGSLPVKGACSYIPPKMKQFGGCAGI